MIQKQCQIKNGKVQCFQTALYSQGMHAMATTMYSVEIRNFTLKQRQIISAYIAMNIARNIIS
jgi:hypothetical protein